MSTSERTITSPSFNIRGGSLRKAVAVSTLGDAALEDAEAIQFRGRFEAG